MTSQTIQKNSSTEQSPITDKAQKTAHDVVDKVAESSAQAEKKTRDGSHRTSEKVSELSNSAQKTGQAYLSKVNIYVQENPLQALGIAVASGYLLSKLLGKKRS